MDDHFSVPSPVDGLMIDALLYLPQGEAKGVLQVVHGMSEYKERYTEFAKEVAQAGYACLLHDHRGHGKSISQDVPLGYFGKNGDKALISDTQAVWEACKDRVPNAKRVLMGHSMGSLVVREAVKDCEKELSGLIVCGSPSENNLCALGIVLVKLFSLFIGGKGKSKIIDAMVFGPFNKGIENPATPFDWINIDASEVEKYTKDPLCGFGFTMNGYEGLMRLMQNVYAKPQPQSENPDLSVLFIQGGEDPCGGGETKRKKAFETFLERGYTNARSIVYQGQRHEILRSPAQKAVRRDIIDFLEQCFTARA